MSFTTEDLSMNTLEWFVGTAGVNMLLDEYNRPELLDFPTLYALGNKMLMEGTGFVVKKDGEPVGAIGSILVSNIFNPKFKTLAEIFWYVLPEHRNSRAGLLVLNAFDARAKEVADEATLSLLSTSQVNIQGLRKRGYNMKELGFVKNFKET